MTNNIHGILGGLPFCIALKFVYASKSLKTNALE